MALLALNYCSREFPLFAVANCFELQFQSNQKQLILLCQTRADFVIQ